MSTAFGFGYEQFTYSLTHGCSLISDVPQPAHAVSQWRTRMGEDHLLPMAAAGRDHQTGSGRLASIGEAEPLAAPFDVTGHRTRCIRMAEGRRQSGVS